MTERGRLQPASSPNKPLWHIATARLGRMRVLMCVLLLVLLPLQSGWAAMATYCTHESEAQSHRVGHHAHAHHKVTTAQGNAGTSADFDADCAHCHGHVVGVIAAEMTIAVTASGSVLPSMQRAKWLAPALPRPERPQWTVHALFGVAST